MRILNKILDDNGSRKKYYCFYSFVFLLTAAAVFSWYLFTGKTLIWSMDGWNQHYKALIYYAAYLRQILHTLLTEYRLVIPAWNPFIGEGSDILSTLHYYVIGDPINILSVLAGTEYMYLMYSFLIILRLYLAGISFSFMCFALGQRNHCAILAGAVSYCFCYWAVLNAARHPYFINPMIYFPLIITGVEMILRKKRPYILTAAVFVSAVSNFYFFYIIAILTVIYAAVRFIEKYGKRLKDYIRPFLQISLASVIGTMMAGLVLLPVIHTFLTDSRMDIVRPWHLFYPWYYYSLLPSLLTYTEGEDFYWACLCHAVPVVLAIGLLLIRKEKGENDRLFKALLAIGALILLIPALGQFINGMSYMSNRWCWGLSLLGSFLLTYLWDDLIMLERRDAIRLFLLICIYTGTCLFLDKSRHIESFYNICLALILLFLLVYVCRKKEQRQYILAVMVLISVISNSFWKNADSDRTKHYSTEAMDVKTVIESSLINETEAIKCIAAKEVQQGDYIRYSGRNLTINANIWKNLSSSNYFWSISNPYVNSFRKDLNTTESIPQKYSDYDDRADLLALSSTKYFTVKKSDASPVPYGFRLLGTVNVQEVRSQELIDQLSAISKDDLSTYQKKMITKHSDEIYRVYRNEHVLPIGYTYNQYMPPTIWKKLSALERQEAMLSAVCLEERPVFCKTVTADPQKTSVSVKYKTDTGRKYVVVDNNTITTTAENQQITLTFEGLSNAETYVALQGLTYTPTSKFDLYFGDESADPYHIYNAVTWDLLSSTEKNHIIRQHLFWINPQVVGITCSSQDRPDQESSSLANAEGGGQAANDISLHDTDSITGRDVDDDAEQTAAVTSGQSTNDSSGQEADDHFEEKPPSKEWSKTISYNTPDYNFYGGRNSFMVNMGYSQNPVRSVTLTFSDMGIYHFDSLQILCRPMAHFTEKINKLKAHSLKNVSFGADTLQGDLHLDQAGILCVTIPYSEGWEAFVDGKKQKVMLANAHYLGLDLDRGSHHILLRYHRPYQKEGLFLSLAGLALLILLITWEERKRKK